MKIQNKRK